MVSKAVPEGWENRRLADIAFVTMGQSPSSKDVNDSGNGIPFLQGNAEFNAQYPAPVKWCSTPLKLADRGDVLMSVRAPVGALNMADQKYCIGRGLAAIRFTNAIAAFGWYALLKNVQQLCNVSQGSTFGAISKKHLETLEFLLPPIPEQRKIAAILSSVDNAIEKTKAVIEQTKVVKKGLMQELLTRGIPGRHRKFLKTPIGEIPEEWEVVVLGKYSRILSGGTPSTKNQKYWKGTIPWITSADILGLHEIIPKKFITKEAIKESATNLIPKDSIIVVTRVGLGKVAINRFDICISQDSQGVIPNKKVFSIEYLAYFLSIAAQNFITRNQGTAIKGILKEDLKSLKVPLPTFFEQQKIAGLLVSLDRRIEYNNKMLDELLIVKTALMQALLSGEKRVKI